MKRRKFIGNLALGVPALALPYAASGLPYPESHDLSDDAWATERKQLMSEANFGRKAGVSGNKGIAVSSHPAVSQEAVKILKAGGNAADAILAASIVQSVVEPHMTTLTGVFSMLYYDAASGRTRYVNGSCNAPLAHKKEDVPLAKISQIAKTPKGVLVPGFWGGFEESHKQFASMPIKTLMADGIRYAKEGFEAYPFVWGEIFTSADLISKSPDGSEIYLPGNQLLRPGDLIIQRKLADVLTRLSEEGSKYFYQGDFARNFAKVMRDTGGLVTEEDFARYKPMVQEPATGSYRDYTIAAAPAPDFGGELIIQLLQMAEYFDFNKHGRIFESYDSTLKSMQIIGEVLTSASLQGFTGNVTPVEKALSKSYAEERFNKLSGKPRSVYDPPKILTPPPPGSNHLTVADSKGNVATVLHSVMSFPWTNGLYVDGVSICAAILHYASGIPNPGDRINSRIGPNIIFKNKKPVLASGSPSVSLMENVFQNTVNILDFGMKPEESVHLPRFGGYSLENPGSFLVENNYNPGILAEVEKLGIKFDRVRPWQWHVGSFEGVYIDPASGMMYACGDPRRAGQAKAV